MKLINMFGHKKAKPSRLLRIMKIGIVCMLLGITTCFATKSYSQETFFKLSLTNEQVKTVFDEIEKNSEFIIFYLDKNVNLKRKVNISVDNEPVEKILEQIFSNTDNTYSIDGRQITIYKKEKADAPIRQQQSKIELQGVILDEDNEPITGANIVEKGTTNGTISDIDGKFRLTVNPTGTLTVSFMGYATREIRLDGRTNLQIILKEENVLLSDVIAIGYGTMKKSDINASIVSVKAEDLVKTSSPDVSEMLMGRAAGLTIRQTSAKPGGGIEVLIRGGASVGAGNDPLYVIDGFPVVNGDVNPNSGTQWNAGSRSPLADINPNDIASIEILKDASATAIYGARGANGVVLITTKRGTEKTKVEYNFNTSFQSIIKSPQLLTGQEFMREQERYLKEQYLITNKIYPYGDTDPNSVSQYYPKYTDDEINAAGVGTNWYDLITRTGRVNQHNLSISYGNDVMKSLVSFNIYDQEGVVETSGFKRYSIRYNLDHKIIKWWDYGLSASGIYTLEKNAALGGDRDANAGIIESALNYNPLIAAEKDENTGAWIQDPNQAMLNHPLSYLDIEDQTKTKRFLGTVFTNFHIIQNELWIKLSGGVDIRDGIRQNYYPTTTRYGSQVGGDANINSRYREDYLFDMTANYQKLFAGQHNLTAMIGYSYQVQNYDEVYARAMGFTSDATSYYKLQAGEQRPVVSSGKAKHVLASYFGRVQYAYDNRYLFTFTARIDGSDRFGKNNRYAFFPSGAFAWRAIQEEFMQEFDWLSDAKLRLSIGQVGNENIGNGAASEYYSFDGRNYYLGDSEKRGINLNKLGNPDLKWETTTEVNFGIDYGFFRNRVNGSIDLFYKEIKDLLSNRSLPHGSVVDNIPWNMGKTQSKGVELTLNTVNMEGPLHWESTLTYTAYRDNWKERDPKVILNPYVDPKGPLTAVYSLIPDGIKQPGEETPTMPGLLPGQQKYKDVNGLDEDGNLTGKPDGKIDQADVVYVGTQAPKFTMGLNNTLRYKGFDLSFFLYASVGGYRWPSTHIEHGVYGGYGSQRLKDNYNFLVDIKDRWNSDHTETNMASGEVSAYDQYGAAHWQKASYLRLKNLTVGYDLANIFKTKRFNARVYLSGQNLFTITGYNGFDPEVENDRASYPQQRTFSIGFDVKF